MEQYLYRVMVYRRTVDDPMETYQILSHDPENAVSIARKLFLHKYPKYDIYVFGFTFLVEFYELHKDEVADDGTEND